MILYLDASALVKRYIDEPGSDLLGIWLARAEVVACCRIGFVEVYRAITLAGPADVPSVLSMFERDWRDITVVEVSELLTRKAAVLGAGLGLRSLDAFHLAAADLLRSDDLQLATWDRRLWKAARSLGIATLPSDEP